MFNLIILTYFTVTWYVLLKYIWFIYNRKFSDSKLQDTLIYNIKNLCGINAILFSAHILNIFGFISNTIFYISSAPFIYLLLKFNWLKWCYYGLKLKIFNLKNPTFKFKENNGYLRQDILKVRKISLNYIIKKMPEIPFMSIKSKLYSFVKFNMFNQNKDFQPIIDELIEVLCTYNEDLILITSELLNKKYEEKITFLIDLQEELKNLKKVNDASNFETMSEEYSYYLERLKINLTRDLEKIADLKNSILDSDSLILVKESFVDLDFNIELEQIKNTYK